MTSCVDYDINWFQTRLLIEHESHRDLSYGNILTFRLE